MTSAILTSYNANIPYYRNKIWDLLMFDKQALLIYGKRAILILRADIEKYQHLCTSVFIVHF